MRNLLLGYALAGLLAAGATLVGRYGLIPCARYVLHFLSGPFPTSPEWGVTDTLFKGATNASR